MDRTGWIGVITCVVLMIGYYWWMSSRMPERAPTPQPTPTAVNPDTSSNPNEPPVTDPDPEPEVVEATLTPMNTENVEYQFTNLGAGIAYADMLDFDLELGSEEPMRLNTQQRHAIGAIRDLEGFETLVYKQEASNAPNELIYTATRPDGLQIRKRFYLAAPAAADGDKSKRANDPHVVHMDLTLTNTGVQAIDLGRFQVYGGSAVPQNRRELFYSAWYARVGGKMKYKNVGWFNKLGFLGMNFRQQREEYTIESSEVHWGGVSNQFFGTILRSVDPLDSEYWVGRFQTPLPGDLEKTQRNHYGMECALGLPQQLLNSNQAETFRFEIYMGPREYARVSKLPDKQGWVMAYDKIPLMGWMMGWITKPVSQVLVWLMVVFGGWLANYGWAIILLTIVVRMVMWPLHAKAHKTSKRMSKLTPKIEELKKKYPDDPQTVQQETMKLWGEYGINPMGGCLPALAQMPIFLGYFRMLSSASELRHEGFLWIDDLSAPDTVGYFPEWVPIIGGMPFNALPFLMAITSYLQFAMMPKTGDKNQRMIFMMMPLLFFFFCYNYASALALYWTFQNLISMAQTYILNKREVPDLVKKKGPKKKGFLQRMQEQAEAAQKAQQAKQRGASGGSAAAGPGKEKASYDRGERTTKPKRKSSGSKGKKGGKGGKGGKRRR